MSDNNFLILFYMSDSIEKPKRNKKDPEEIKAGRRMALEKGRAKLALLREQQKEKKKKEYVYEYEDEDGDQYEDENDDGDEVEEESGYVVKPISKKKPLKKKQNINLNKIEEKIDSLTARLDKIHEKRKPKRRLARTPKEKEIVHKEAKKSEPLIMTYREQLLRSIGQR